jgi:hypothetical protein
MADGWYHGVAKAMERENAAFVPPEPAATAKSPVLARTGALP